MIRREWWTVKQVAEHYGMSVRSVYDAIAAKRLTVHRFGQGKRGVRIANDDRLDWERQCRVNSRESKQNTPLLGGRDVTHLVAKHFGR